MAEDEINERDVQLLLAAAVAAIGGQPREGQREMTAAVAEAFESGEHLACAGGHGHRQIVGLSDPGDRARRTSRGLHCDHRAAVAIRPARPASNRRCS